jgi:hypothetical protein
VDEDAANWSKGVRRGSKRISRHLQNIVILNILSIDLDTDEDDLSANFKPFFARTTTLQ